MCFENLFTLKTKESEVKPSIGKEKREDKNEKAEFKGNMAQPQRDFLCIPVRHFFQNTIWRYF